MSPLADARVLNTRPMGQAETLDAALIARGAHPVSFPCIEIAPPDDPRPLATAMQFLLARAFDCLVFTSANAVSSVADALSGAKLPSGIRIAAVGEATAESVRATFGFDSVVVPGIQDAAGLAAELDAKMGDRILLPVSSIGRRDLADCLRARGAEVTVVPAYRTRTGTGGANLGPMLAAGELDAVLFASPSAVDGFLERIEGLGYGLTDVQLIRVACIGPTTAARARERGFQSITTSSQQTISGLLDAFETALAPVRKGVVRCP